MSSPADDDPLYEISVRPRRQVHPFLLRLLSPLFRFSYGRSAYVTRDQAAETLAEHRAL